MARYQIHPAFSKLKELIHYIPRKGAVNLAGTDTVKKHPETQSGDAWEEPVPAATQEDLKWVYEQGAKARGNKSLVVIAKEAPKPAKK